ncbi:hypothetical protein G9A89_003087 [Geosiphon pyriformis]|nr:hypothetical protein G9A89_003087 [Geosiphon pyriformis]
MKEKCLIEETSFDYGEDGALVEENLDQTPTGSKVKTKKALETNTHDIWDFIGFMDGKTCAIDYYSVTYTQTRCAVVCFDSAESLDAVIETTLVLRSITLHWSYLGYSKCTKCEKMDHISLGCSVNRTFSSGKAFCKALSDVDKSKLASIYVKHLALIACSVAFGGVFWVKVASSFSFSLLFVYNNLAHSGSFSEVKPPLSVSVELNDRFAALEHSLASLTECVDKLAKSLDAPGPIISQLSPRWQANKDYWKFDFKGADDNKWKNYKNAMLANTEMLSNEFATTVKFSDLDAIVFTKNSSRFYKLKLLVLKFVKTSHEESIVNFDLIDFGANFDCIQSVLSGIRKSYCVFKLAKSLAAKKAHIKTAIEKKMVLPDEIRDII